MPKRKRGYKAGGYGVRKRSRVGKSGVRKSGRKAQRSGAMRLEIHVVSPTQDPLIATNTGVPYGMKPAPASKKARL